MSNTLKLKEVQGTDMCARLSSLKTRDARAAGTSQLDCQFQVTYGRTWPYAPLLKKNITALLSDDGLKFFISAKDSFIPCWLSQAASDSKSIFNKFEIHH